MPSSRRFPPPWYVDEVADGFCVRDDRGQALTYIYYQSKRYPDSELTRDEARRIAINIVKLPELVKRPQRWRQPPICEESLAAQAAIGPLITHRFLGPASIERLPP